MPGVRTAVDAGSGPAGRRRVLLTEVPDESVETAEGIVRDSVAVTLLRTAIQP
jgi:hypothetical protein